ncbi:MAG: T9SS type A sorting domain-containing protein, partial [Flavobacteriales bacterium]|nr:T9SS type A sorting domain-containing protein [Flavobacteriales bacterium]
PGQYYFLKGVGFDQLDFQSVGIDEEIIAINNISVYPNPAHTHVTIEIKEGTSFNYHIRDVLGRIVISNRVNGVRTTVNLSNNGKGIYFIEVQIGKSKRIEKLVLTK